MFSKIDIRNNDYTGHSNNGQLLREIEAISNALYFQKNPRKALLSPSDIQFQSCHKTRLSGTKETLNQEFLGEDVSHEERKAPSIWNWMKPLKSLAHVGHKKFSCLFNLHVHSIDGLPSDFNDASLRVHWKRKDDMSQTRPSKAIQGVVEFNEILIHKCSVYGGRSGLNHTAKYNPILFVIYVSVIGAQGVDIGKHWIDVTRLLPPTLEDLEGEKGSGRWTTTFKLSGKANGALLHVSFCFLTMKDGLAKPGQYEVPKLLNLIQNRSNAAKITAGFGTTSTEMAQPVRGVLSSLSYRSVVPPHSVDEKNYHEVLLNPSLELSQSIDFLYQKLDEEDLCGSVEADFEFLEQLSVEPDTKLESEKETDQDYGETEFTVVDCGIEIDNEKQCKFDEVTDKTICSVNNIHSTDLDVVVNDDIESILAWLDSPSEHISVVSKLQERDNRTVEKASYTESKTLKKSSSLDDVTDSVISDFLGMLGLECGSFRHSVSDPESPRELLLRQFEDEALVSCNSIFYCDTPDEGSDYGSCDLSESGFNSNSESFDFASSNQFREEHKGASQLINRRKGQILENLKTEVVTQTCDTDEDIQDYPHYCAAGFGSPIELPPDDPLKLPPLDEGFDSFIRLKGGGFFRSMNPAVFKDCRNEGKLLIQLSHPVVLPAEMGSNFMEILHRLASIGLDKLYMKINKLMFLEDIKGKPIPQIETEAASSSVGYERKPLFQDKLSHGSSDGKIEAGKFSGDWNYSEVREDHVSPEELIYLAMDRIEVLSVEGLKIQSDMSNENAPSQITSSSNHKSLVIRESLDSVNAQDRNSDIEGLMDLSITLDEWLKLDSGFLSDDNKNHENVMKILEAHHAKSIDIGQRSTRDSKVGKAFCEEAGLFGNNLAVALLLQLRDPSRSLEPVGIPMLCLIQVRRTYIQELVLIKERTDEFNEGEGSYMYKFDDIHLLGMNSKPSNEHVWGTAAQRLSASRWLLPNGVDKTIELPLSETKGMVGSSPTVTEMQEKDVLWSISSHVHGKGSDLKELIYGTSHSRNPDIIFEK